MFIGRCVTATQIPTDLMCAANDVVAVCLQLITEHNCNIRKAIDF